MDVHIDHAEVLSSSDYSQNKPDVRRIDFYAPQNVNINQYIFRACFPDVDPLIVIITSLSILQAVDRRSQSNREILYETFLTCAFNMSYRFQPFKNCVRFDSERRIFVFRRSFVNLIWL